jgi:hypothetical protein
MRILLHWCSTSIIQTILRLWWRRPKIIHISTNSFIYQWSKHNNMCNNINNNNNSNKNNNNNNNKNIISKRENKMYSSIIKIINNKYSNYHNRSYTLNKICNNNINLNSNNNKSNLNMNKNTNTNNHSNSKNKKNSDNNNNNNNNNNKNKNKIKIIKGIINKAIIIYTIIII